MKKIAYFIIFILLISSVSAHYWECGHFAIAEKAIQDPTIQNSYWVSLIKGREQIYYGCIAGVDALVVYYNDRDTRKDYQQSHQKSAYETCMDLAGSNKNYIVCCLGIGTHQVQDPTSHGFKEIEGYTPQCIETYWGKNLFHHASCENAVNEQYLSTLTGIEKEKLVLQAGNAYDIFEDQNPDPEVYYNEYADLIAKSIGFDTDSEKQRLYSAIATVGFYVKKGMGSGYHDMYNDIKSLPTQWWITPALLGIISLLAMIFVPILGKNNWKWVLFSLFAVTFLVVAFLFVAGISGYAFSWFNSFAIYLPTMVFSLIGAIGVIGIIATLPIKGILRYVSIAFFSAFIIFSIFLLLTTGFGKIVIPNYQQYLDKDYQMTVDFLKNAESPVSDASGLTFTEGGVIYQGALDKAEWKWTIIQLVIFSEVAYLLIVLLIQMFKTKKVIR